MADRISKLGLRFLVLIVTLASRKAARDGPVKELVQILNTSADPSLNRAADKSDDVPPSQRKYFQFKFPDLPGCVTSTAAGAAAPSVLRWSDDIRGRTKRMLEHEIIIAEEKPGCWCRSFREEHLPVLDMVTPALHKLLSHPGIGDEIVVLNRTDGSRGSPLLWMMEYTDWCRLEGEHQIFKFTRGARVLHCTEYQSPYPRTFRTCAMP